MSTVGICLAVGGLFQLKGLENIDHLVTSGFYTKLRHPMYTGFILWIVGWIIYNVTIVSSIIGLLCTLNILYWRMIEEKKLESQFGDEYRRYERSTLF
jgi:protein-S-isoprenylcysteine O-methyltransferase Ste14